MDPEEQGSDSGAATATATSGTGTTPPAADSTSSVATAPYNNVDAEVENQKADSWGSKVYHGILSALGGSGDVQYSRDATGKMTATPVKSGPGQQWKRIISGALSGYAASTQAGTGPGATARAAGLGVQAGMNQAKERRQQAVGEANEDFEAQQKAAVQSAQLALLSHQIAKSTFDLGRAQVDASVADSDRETNFSKVMSEGGDGTHDMGVFPDFQAVMKAFREVPELHDHQAGGRIITIPHINSEGKVDGIHAALVTPDWLNSKINVDLPIVTRTYKNGKMEEQTFTIPAGSLNGLQYSQMVMSDSTRSVDDWTKVADVGVKQGEEKVKEKLEPSEEAKNYADAYEAKSKALLDQAAAAAKDADVDWGPGGAKGFNSWHKENVTPALATEQTYRLSSNVYNEYQKLRAQGKDFPTGAQSVQMLSNHIANTFGNVKGARVTKDMISQHLGARSISDSAQVAVQKLFNGDTLSPKQWDAYFSLVGQTRDEKWRSILDDAEALGRPLDYIAFPQDLRNRWGIGPGRVQLGQPRQAAPAAQPAAAGQPGAGAGAGGAAAAPIKVQPGEPTATINGKTLVVRNGAWVEAQP